MKRISRGTGLSLCVQPAFIIGTNNEDGTYNFAPITWVSVTCREGDDYLLVVSMFGTKATKQNVLRDGLLSVNLVSREMLPLMDHLGRCSAKDGCKDMLGYGVGRGEKADVPTLDDSPWVYECRVSDSVETGSSTTFFCRTVNIQTDETIDIPDSFSVDLTGFDPVIYSGMYHSIGKNLGGIGNIKP